jgi:hypothetical protein
MKHNIAIEDIPYPSALCILGGNKTLMAEIVVGIFELFLDTVLDTTLSII